MSAATTISKSRREIGAFSKARAAYGELKAALASRFPDDIGAYCDGKDEFVKEYERRALIWHWQKLAASRLA